MLKNLLVNYFPQSYPANNYQGAVIFLFAENGIILMKRSQNVPSHRGQMAFFGGHKMPHETDPAQTALREFAEESSVSSDHVNILAYLPPLLTHQNFLIAPVIGELSLPLPEFSQQLKSNGEWDSLFYVPFSYLAKPSNWVHAKMNNTNVLYCPLPQTELQILKNTNNAQLNNQVHILWGITAKLIWSFLNTLSHLQVTPKSSIS
jgi:8-oxo-dGTP pyrophosphatase MutT (NUDIX family)